MKTAITKSWIVKGHDFGLGFNVYPNEVEDVLASHPRVTESAVVGVPNEEQGESVKAYLVADGELSVEELDAWCRERLTAYKVPKAFEFRDELPKTNVGKVCVAPCDNDQGAA